MWTIQLTDTDKPALRITNPADWVKKEVSAIIQMTVEFLKDMDMKMRDVHRVEKYYYGTKDFGAGRIFSQIETKFEHMVTLYKNTSYIMRLFTKDINLRSDVVGSLQFMLSDYMEMLSLIDIFKERYSYWRANSERARVRDIVKRFLLRHKEHPFHYDQEEDQWRRFAVRARIRPFTRRNVTADYIGFDVWRLAKEYFSTVT